MRKWSRATPVQYSTELSPKDFNLFNVFSIPISAGTVRIVLLRVYPQLAHIRTGWKSYERDSMVFCLSA